MARPSVATCGNALGIVFVSIGASGLLYGPSAAAACDPSAHTWGPATGTATLTVTDDGSGDLRLTGLHGSLVVDVTVCAGTSLVIIGGDGDDGLTANQTGGFSWDGGPGVDTLVVNGVDGTDNFMIRPASIDRDGAAQIVVDGTESVRVNGFGGDDVFTVEGSYGASSLVVNGGEGRDIEGLSVNATAWTHVFNGGEGQDTVLLSAPTLTASDVALNGDEGADVVEVHGHFLSSGLLAFDGGDDADVFRFLSFSSTTNGLVQAGGPGVQFVSDGSGTMGLASTELVQVDLRGTTDDLIDISPAGLSAAGLTEIHVTGGGGDVLVVLGTSGDDDFTITGDAIGIDGLSIFSFDVPAVRVQGFEGADSFTASVSTPRSSFLDLDGGGGDDEAIVSDLTLDGQSLAFNGEDGDDRATVHGAISLTSSSLLLNGAGGDDHATFFANVLGEGLGFDGGEDVLGDILTVHGTADADTITVLSTMVIVDGQSPYPYSTTESVIVNGLGNGDVFVVTGSFSESSLDVNGGDGPDAIELSTDFTSSGLLAFDGGDDVDAFTFVARNRSTAHVQAGLGGVQVVIDGSGAAGLASTEQVSLLLMGTDDWVDVSTGGLAGAGLTDVVVEGDGSTTLVVIGTDGDDDFTLAGPGVDIGGLSVSWSEVPFVRVQALSGEDSFAANDVAYGSAYIELDGGDDDDEAFVGNLTLAEATLVFNGGGGDDRATVSGDVILQAVQGVEAHLVLDGGDGDDSTTLFARVDGLGAAVSGGAHVLGDTLTINGTADADDITLSGTSVTATGQSPYDYASFEFLNVNALAGADTVTLSPPFGAAVALDGGNPTTAPGDTVVLNGASVAYVNFETIVPPPCDSFAIDTADLPGATSCVAYAQIVTASGGTGAVSFALTAGAVPTGLAFGADGALAGTPTLAGIYPFTIRATDGAACTDDRAYAIVVLSGPDVDGDGIGNACDTHYDAAMVGDQVADDAATSIGIIQTLSGLGGAGALVLNLQVIAGLVNSATDLHEAGTISTNMYVVRLRIALAAVRLYELQLRLRAAQIPATEEDQLVTLASDMRTRIGSLIDHAADP